MLYQGSHVKHTQDVRKGMGSNALERIKQKSRGKSVHISDKKSNL